MSTTQLPLTPDNDRSSVNTGPNISNANTNTSIPNIVRAPSPLHSAPQHTYTTGIPGPPRILIPPHLAASPGGNYLRGAISGPFADLYNTAYPPNPNLSVFLGTPDDAQRWTYENRRQAQQILPWLWLGSMTATRDRDLLAERGITLLVAVRSSMAAKVRLWSGIPGATVDITAQSPLKHTPGIVGNPAYVILDVPSTPGAPLIPTFRAAAQLIDRNYLAPIITPEQLAELDNTSESPDYHSLVQEHYAQYTYSPSLNCAPVLQHALNPFPPGTTRPGSTLVFCETGNDKSAVVVASYIMQHYESTLVQAVQVVQGRRFSVGFDDNHKYALVTWETIYKSNRDVYRAQKQQHQQQEQQAQQPHTDLLTYTRGKKKRGYEDEMNDDEDVVSSQDAIAVHGRSGTAPFIDGHCDSDTKA